MEVIPIVAYSYAGNREVEGSSTSQPPLSGLVAWADTMIDTWRGMSWAPKVQEIWNEPWNVTFFKPAPNAATYYQMVRTYCARAWAVWPEAIMLVCADTGTGGNPSTWHAELLAADVDKFLCDPRIRPTAHLYCEERPPSYQYGIESAQRRWAFDRYKYTYADWRAHGHPHPWVWVTEYGWEVDGPSIVVETTPVSEALQAQYHIEALEQLRLSGIVEAAFPFKYDTFGPVKQLAHNLTYVVDPSPTAPGTPRVAYYAIRDYTNARRR
jgi:hypothetical protein